MTRPVRLPTVFSSLVNDGLCVAYRPQQLSQPDQPSCVQEPRQLAQSVTWHRMQSAWSRLTRFLQSEGDTSGLRRLGGLLWQTATSAPPVGPTAATSTHQLLTDLPVGRYSRLDSTVVLHLAAIYGRMSDCSCDFRCEGVQSRTHHRWHLRHLSLSELTRRPVRSTSSTVQYLVATLLTVPDRIKTPSSWRDWSLLQRCSRGLFESSWAVSIRSNRIRGD